MKIIALMPVKNAAWSLPAYISSVAKITKEIIVVEDGSNDGTNELLEKAGATIYTLPPYTKTMTSHSEHRNFLLQKGREAGGTHFIWIDSDEAFTAQFISNAKELIGSLKPGQKLAMRWLTLWKSAYQYRDDSSVWSNLYKDFITCDTPEYSFGKQLFHEARTPGPNTKENTLRLPIDKGAVLHFQSAAWEAYQIKQAFYRCSEL
ncbi:MAG: glycosyltransferase, partial [Candidatus Bilamarchaeaceae archaeon]